MAKISIKIPRKLSRIEVVHDKKIETEDYFEYIPLKDVPEDHSFREIFVDEIADLRNEETEKEIFLKENIPIIQSFSHEVTFVEQLKPIEIDIEKLPDDVILTVEAKKKIQEAYEKGFSDGQEVASNFFKEDMKKHQTWVRQFDTVSRSLRTEYSKEMKNLEEMIISLGMLAAKHILQHEVSGNSNIIIEQVKKAIAELDDEIIFKIFVNPDDYEILNEVKSELLSSPEAAEKIEILRDEKVEPGGCLLVTSSGIIDARMRTQLAMIKNKLDSVPITSIQTQ